MSLSNIYLIIYIILWTITFVFYLKKKKSFGVGNLILASYLSYAILSYFLYNYDYTGDDFGDLELFPFVYLYLMLFIALLPVLRFDENKTIQKPSTYLINVLAYSFVFSSLVVVPFILVEVKDGIMTILFTESGGDELYNAYRLYGEEKKEWSLYNVFRIVFNFYTDFGFLLFLYYSTLKEKKKWLLFGMAIAIFVSMLESLSNGLRTSITMKLLLVVSTYFLFRKHIPNKQKKVIDISGVVIVSFFLFYIITVNVSRFSDKEYDSSYQLINYVGQANLYFNKYGLDAGEIRYGDRTCAQFKRWLQFDDVPEDFLDCRTKHRKMKLDDSHFSTFVGDFTLDFGPIGAAVIICLFSFLIVRLTKTRRNIVLFHQLILIFFVMEVCVQGGFYLYNFSFNNNLRIVYLFLFYLLFKWDYNLTSKKNCLKM